MTDRSSAELGRDIDRIERTLKEHMLTHVSVDQFNALKEDVQAIKGGIAKGLWLLVGQLVVVAGGITLALILRSIH